MRRGLMQKLMWIVVLTVAGTAAGQPPFLGDYKEDSTLEVYWHTYDESNGAAVTYSSETIAVYKDHGTTPITAGLTTSKDHNSKTGLHITTVDLSASASYTTGSTYCLAVDATVSGQTYTRWIGCWMIEHAHLGMVWHNVITGYTYPSTFGKYVYTMKDRVDDLWDKKPTGNFVDAADVDAECDEAIANAFSFVGTDVKATLDGETVGLSADAITASVYDETTAFPVTSADSGATQIARVGADADTLETLSDELDTIVADTNELQTDWANGGRLDLLLDDIPNTIEFEGRTLLDFNYFDPNTDEVELNDGSLTASKFDGSTAFAQTGDNYAKITDADYGLAHLCRCEPAANTLNVDVNHYAWTNVKRIENGDASDAINAACDEAIETYKLDHLVAAAESDDPVDNSILAKLASKTGDWSTFSTADDSMEGLGTEVNSGTWGLDQLCRCTYPANALTSDASGYVFADVKQIEDADPSYVIKQAVKAMMIDGHSFADITAYVAAALAGKISGAHTGNVTIKQVGGETTRIQAAVDEFGNRSEVSLTPP